MDDIRYFEISPHFIDALDYAKAHYESAFGKVEVMWQKKGETISLDISMPDGTYGKAVLNDGFSFENGDTVAELSGGEYNFVIKNNV